MRHTALGITAAALLSGLALTGCGGSSNEQGQPVAGLPTSTLGAEPAPSEESAPAPADPGQTDTPTSTTARCHTGDLQVTDQPDDGGGAMGHHGELLIFKNRSDHACTLYGFPGVSFVTGDDGKQVGSAFERGDGTKKTVELAAGSSAHATIVLVTAENYDAGDCKPVQVRGYRVYPPDETAAIFVSKSQTACSAQGQGIGQVQPITTGTTAS